MEFFDQLSKFFASPLFRVMTQFFWFFLMFIWGSLIYWTYRDAKQRGAMALYWASVVAIFTFFGWVIYMIVRPPELLDDVRERELEIKSKMSQLHQSGSLCPQCNKPIENDFLICPHCRKRLKISCPKCKKPLNPSWLICPYCQSNV